MGIWEFGNLGFRDFGISRFWEFETLGLVRLFDWDFIGLRGKETIEPHHPSDTFSCEENFLAIP